MKNIDDLCIDTIKVNGVAAVQKANSGHPGIVLGSASITHTLYSEFLNFDPRNPQWINRDRFILSAGHGSALLYSQLSLLGLVSMEELKNFRQINFNTAGHPEFNHLPGVEATTGPLGQGIAMAVGIALAQAHLNAKFKEIDHYTYVLCGDGDLQEGVAMEALSFAGFQQLNKLIILHDSNNIQLDTAVNCVFNENLKMKMESMNFFYQLVEENNVEQISKAIENARKSSKPSFIEVKTIIGQGSKDENSSKVHGAPLAKEDFDNLKAKLNWTQKEFIVPEEVKEFYQETIFKRGKEAFDNFKMSKELEDFVNQKGVQINLEIKKDQATRNSSGQVIQYLNENLTNWIGGSADLSGSTKALGGDGEFCIENRKGRNILFGVREFAMAAIANGIALHSNLRPFVSTFFVFTDYLKPALRLSALMKLPVTYIMTHDSVFVGEDGPTHQPIEQLAMIRSIPNVNMFRPADEKEVIGAYQVVIDQKDRPTVIALTRQNIVSLEETNSAEMKNGYYYLLKTDSPWTLLSTGSELANSYKIAKELNLNLISIVNFNSIKEIEWSREKAISIEAGVEFGWSKFAKFNIGINTFGYSGPGEKVYEKVGLDLENLRKKINVILEQDER